MRWIRFFAPGDLVLWTCTLYRFGRPVIVPKLGVFSHFARNGTYAVRIHGNKSISYVPFDELHHA